MINYPYRKKFTEEYLGYTINPMTDNPTKEDFNNEWIKKDPENFYKETELFIKQGCANAYTKPRENIVNDLDLFFKSNGILRIADVGGGCGFYTEALANKGYIVDIIEYSDSKTFDFLKKYFENRATINVIKWDDFTRNEKHYDSILAFDFLEHFERPMEVVKYLKLKTSFIIETSHFGDKDYLMHYVTKATVKDYLNPEFKNYKKLTGKINIWKR